MIKTSKFLNENTVKPVLRGIPFCHPNMVL